MGKNLFVLYCPEKKDRKGNCDFVLCGPIVIALEDQVVRHI